MNGRILQVPMVAAATIASLVVAALASPSAAEALTRTENFVTTDRNGTLSMGPPRLETDVIPGSPMKFQAVLLNRTTEPVSLDIRSFDITASPNPKDFIQKVEKAQFGAGTWVRPEIDKIVLKPGEKAEFDVTVRPPADAAVGSNYAGLVAAISQTAADGGPMKVSIAGEVLSQLYFNVPGEIVRKGFISKASIAEAFVFHGSSYVTYDVEYKNEGNVTDHVHGSIDIYSMFGNKVKSIPLQDRVVLRNSTRSMNAIWTDPPRFGRFTAKVNLKSDTGRHEKKVAAVTVLPPWWWLVIMGAAIALPLAYTWWQRRNDWEQYLDEDWDEDWDEEEDFDLSENY